MKYSSHLQCSYYLIYPSQKPPNYIASLPESTRYEISRNKGLGEMDAKELRETTMSIENRVLILKGLSGV